MTNNLYKPDCGYAWFVVAACFIINFIMAGLARAAGVLYIALIDVYHVSRETATTPFSLRFCVRNLSGPIVGILGQRFGIRPIVLLGGLICGLGGIISALASDVTWITVGWGGIHGLGYGMSNLIHVIFINRYFNKYKGLAMGICLTGDCFGTFLLPVLMELLLSIYDLKGTFLILAGISLNVVPAAMLLRSPAWEEQEQESQEVGAKLCEEGYQNEGFDMSSEDYDNKTEMNNKEFKLPIITVNDLINNQDSEESQLNMVDKNKESNDQTQLQVQYGEFCFSDKNKNIFLADTFALTDVQYLRESSSLRLKGNLKKTRLSCNVCSFKTNRKSRCTSISSVLSCPSQVGKNTPDCKRKDTINSVIPYSSSDIIESVKNLIHKSDQNLNASSQNINSAVSTNTKVLVENSDKSITQIIIPSIPVLFSEEKDHLQQKIKKCINIKIENDYSESLEKHQPNSFKMFLKTNIKPIFLVISATLAFYVFLFISVFTIIIDYASDNDIPSEYGKYLIIAFSVTDIFGRVGFGIVLDKNWIARSHYAGITAGLMGLCMFLIPFYKCFIFWMISFSLCGFIQGGVAIMFPGLVEYYMEKNEEPVALGCLNFYGGVLMFPLPCMIGYFRDTIGSYDGVFWTVGALCIFVSSLWMLEPCLVRKQNRVTKTMSIIDDRI